MTLSQAAEAHLDDVHAYLVYLTGDRVLAEDLTAATFERKRAPRDDLRSERAP